MARMRGTLGTGLPDVLGLRIGPPPWIGAPHRLDCMAFHGNGNALRAYGYRRPPAAAAKPELSRCRDRPWPAVTSRIGRLTSRFRDRLGIRSALWPLLLADRPTPQVVSAAISRASPPSRRPDFFCFSTPSCGRAGPRRDWKTAANGLRASRDRGRYRKKRGVPPALPLQGVQVSSSQTRERVGTSMRRRPLTL